MVGIHPSHGCGSPSGTGSPAPGSLLNETLLWRESGLPAVNRTVLTYVPSSARDGQPMPLVMVFHGWGGHAIAYHERYTFGALAEAAGFLAVYPEGLSDGWANSAGWTSWNSGDTTAEHIDGVDTQVCDPKHLASGSTCYVSCMIRGGKCDPCSWTTCYDDVAFVRWLLRDLASRFCVDLSSVFAYGCSNGGMFVHQLARRLPEDFRAIAAACGGKPHKGYERNFTRGGPPVSMLLLQGLKDHTIPESQPRPGDGWWDGYIYASDVAVLEAYKDYNGCSNDAPQLAALPPNVRSESLSCTDYGFDCSAGAVVTECTFAGGHDLVTGLGANAIMDGPELAWHFFCQHVPDAAGRPGEVACLLPQRSSNQSSGGFPLLEPECLGLGRLAAESLAVLPTERSPAGSQWPPGLPGRNGDGTSGGMSPKQRSRVENGDQDSAGQSNWWGRGS